MLIESSNYAEWFVRFAVVMSLLFFIGGGGETKEGEKVPGGKIS